MVFANEADREEELVEPLDGLGCIQLIEEIRHADYRAKAERGAVAHEG
ncbi:hypothetical protein [Haloplanus natans]|nr:hypothetical protein [Haloplanus natans]